MAHQKGIGKLVDPYWKARFKYPKYPEKAPLDEKAVLFESLQGKEFNGMIFYILKYMAYSEEYKDFKFYLAAASEKTEEFKDKLREYKIKGITIVNTKGESYFKALATCKYLVNDDAFPTFFIKREGQVYLNTLHGTPLKTHGCKVKEDGYRIGNEQKNFVCADYLLFQNDHTKNIMFRDYFLENLARGKAVVAGCPRNDVFFDPKRAEEVKKRLAPNGERIYAYMPTHRGGTSSGNAAKATAFFIYYLYELDEKLEDDEILYTNIHPLAPKDISFENFKHIKPFPKRLETYDVLNACDLLVTDYSGTLFDFMCTGKKIILYLYDKEDYLRDRGTYMSVDELPFPQVRTTDELVRELRTGKEYNDDALREEFCHFDGPESSKKLMDMVILQKDTGLKTEEIPDNGKENVFLYGGNLAANGMTASLRTLLKNLDTQKRNYYISFCTETAAVNKGMLATFKGQAGYFGVVGDMTLTRWQSIIRKLFKDGYIKAGLYMFLMKKAFRNDLLRQFGGARIDRLVQFTGYEAKTILEYSIFEGDKSIFVHNDMLGEIKLKGNQRKDVLSYAYRHYDKVAIVTDDILPSTRKLAGRRANIVRVKNTIAYEDVLSKKDLPVTFDSFTESTVSEKRFNELISGTGFKFINVGRFSPEKGQMRLIKAFRRFLADHNDAKLVIVGGYQRENAYTDLRRYIEDEKLKDSVILIMKMLNPYPVINACDAFVLSSFYEGFGLVIAEADICGKPVASTDIVGPAKFMKEHGGFLVENSDEGVYRALTVLAEHKVKPLNIDYAAYNKEAVSECEDLFK